MTSGEGNSGREAQQSPSFEIVQGQPIEFTPEEISTLDESFGIPERVAEAVSQQIHSALIERKLQPESVRFSGYPNANDREHAEKSTGEFAGEDGAHTYFFTDFAALTDGQEGPLAHAATTATPAIGVYELDRLLALGYSELHEQAKTTPQALASALLFEFRPKYAIDFE